MKKTLIQISTLAFLATAVFTVESCRKTDPPAKTITPMRGDNTDANGGNGNNGGSNNGGSGNNGGGNNGGGATVTGCTDQDSPNYDPNANSNDNSCEYVYVTSYEISYYPSSDNGSDWDYGFGSTTNADLILKVKESASSNAIFEGAEISNQDPSSPAVWQEAGSVKLKNMNYDWELVDYDSSTPDDPISNGTFNPFTLLSATTGTGTVTTTAGGSQLVISYSIHQ